MKGTRTDHSNVLIIGIGNCGRSDDGLGWLFLDAVAKKWPGCFDIEYRYQLQVEDSELAGKYDLILFADSTELACDTGFELYPCKKKEHYYFSSHSQSPEAILYLCHALYDKQPQAYVLAIAGYDWDLKEGISPRATANLEKALEHFEVFADEVLLAAAT